MKRLLTLFCSSLYTASVFAGEPPPAAPLDTAAPARETLTGDWFGQGAAMRDRGFSLDLSATNFYQGLVEGEGDDDFDFGGRADAFLNFDFEKLGLWTGGGLRTHFEYRYGDIGGFRGGALLPVNTGAVLPLGTYEEIEATSIYFTQKFGSRAQLMAGKINVVDLLAADPFYGGWGTRRFMNTGIVAPISGVLPPTIMGGVLSIQSQPVSWTLMVYDANDRTSDYFPDDLFDNGVNISAGGTWTGDIAGRSSSFALTGIYSTKDGADLGEVLLPPELQTSTKDGAWSVIAQFGHSLTDSKERPLGLYLRGAICDGNPNPIQGYFAGGLSGRGLFAARPQDGFGLGVFYYDFSDDLQNAVNPLVQFGDERGVELFYDVAITPWWHVTADAQFINPASGGRDDAFVLGLRSRFDF